MSKSQEVWSSIRFLVIRNPTQQHASLSGEEQAKNRWRSNCRLLGKIATSHFSLIIVLILYSFAGAAMFAAVEWPKEQQTRTDLQVRYGVYSCNYMLAIQLGPTNW